MSKIYLLDLDGTMYHGKNIIPSAKKFIDHCLKNNIRFYFVTNNASRTLVENAQHMLDMGYENIAPEMFFTSAMAACLFVKKNYDKRKAFVIGSSGLKEALNDNGFTIVEKDADFVFVGLDKDANYARYSLGVQNLLDHAILVGTNLDQIILTEKGPTIGNGSVVKMMEYASGQQSLQLGKPFGVYLDECLSYFDLSKDEVIMVGDNLLTDIALGVNCNIDTALVLTGIHQKEDIDKLNIKPTIVINDLTELVNI
ncbi:MAG: HAD-IIA family hydrolase [Erysipelotrichaceae bacterium]